MSILGETPSKRYDHVSDGEIRELFDSLPLKMQDWLIARAEGKALGEILNSREEFCEYFGINSEEIRG